MSSLFFLYVCVFHMDFMDSVKPTGYLQGNRSCNDQPKIRGYYLQVNICPHRPFRPELVSSQVLRGHLTPREESPGTTAQNPSLPGRCPRRWEISIRPFLLRLRLCPCELDSLSTMVGAPDRKVSLTQYFGCEHTQNRPAVDSREK